MTQALSQNPAPLLTVERLSIVRGEHLLIEGLSFSLDAGDTLWVTGSNGIGKTSLLKSVAGLLRPEAGFICWRGTDIYKFSSADTGYQGHQDSHKPNLTALENLRFWQSIYASPLSAQEILETVGLSAHMDIRAKHLSAGQSRRLSLARLLMKRASLWVLDEPAAALDVKGRDLIHALVADHVASGGCAVIASHTAPEKIGKHTRVLTLNGGADA